MGGDAESGEDRIVWEDRRPLGRCQEGNIGNLFPADSGLIGVAVDCWDGSDGALYTFDPEKAEATLVPHTEGWSGMVQTPRMDFGIADGRGGDGCAALVAIEGDQSRPVTVDIRAGDDVDRLQPNGIADCSEVEFTRNITYSNATGSLAFSFSENFSGEHPQDSIARWNLTTTVATVALKDIDGTISDLEFSRDGTQIYASINTRRGMDGGKEGLLRIDLPTNDTTWVMTGENPGPLADSPDHTELTYAIEGEFFIQDLT